MERQFLIDTDCISYFLKGDAAITKHFVELISKNGLINISILTVFEIRKGLAFYNPKRLENNFDLLLKVANIFYLTDKTARIAAEKYAELRKNGTPIDSMDLLIGCSAIENNFILVTYNGKHFSRIHGLDIANWSKE